MNAVSFIPALVLTGTTVYFYLRMKAARQDRWRTQQELRIARVILESQERRLSEFPRR